MIKSNSRAKIRFLSEANSARVIIRDLPGAFVWLRFGGQ